MSQDKSITINPKAEAQFKSSSPVSIENIRGQVRGLLGYTPGRAMQVAGVRGELRKRTEGSRALKALKLLDAPTPDPTE